MLAPPHDLHATVARLNRASVTKRFDAYRDVAWEAEGAAIDPRDPRFCLPESHPLGGTDWYRALPEATRAELGLDRVCQVLRTGISFEACLSGGLLEFAAAQPNGSPLYRYAMHEVIEESHHSMMFHEFIRRSGRDPDDLPWFDRWLQRRVVQLGRTFPELFFLCVLSGEVFIDSDNRELLRANRDATHPLLRRIIQIHVTEEARHVCFATAYLRDHLPRAAPWKQSVVRAVAPMFLARGARDILYPSPSLIQRYAIPRQVVEQSFGPDSAHASRVREIIEPILMLVGARPAARSQAARARG